MSLFAEKQQKKQLHENLTLFNNHCSFDEVVTLMKTIIKSIEFSMESTVRHAKMLHNISDVESRPPALCPH